MVYGGLRTTIFDLSGAWMSSMKLRVEESCSDRSEDNESEKRKCWGREFQSR